MAGSRVTEPRDLRTGRPVWQSGAAARFGGPPEGSFSTDVAVIGGGISGALLADAALRAGRQVTVLDRRGFVLGSTPASTALLQFELDQPLTLLARRIGRDRAARAWWRSAQAVDLLRARVADLGIACGFRERHAAYLPGNVLDVAGLRREAEARARLGLRSRYVTRAELRELTGLDRPGAIWSAGAAEVDPVRLTRGLWRSVAARGGTFVAPAEVVDIRPRPRSVVLALAGGQEVTARTVVLATGYELGRMWRPRGYRIISTWAIATAPQKQALWPTRCLIWEAADPYLYIRTTADHRVLIGGEDAEIADEQERDGRIPRKIAALRRKVARLLPGISTEPEFAWAGSFGSSSTSLPAIGPVPGAERCFAVIGFGGNGITFSVIAAEMFQRHLMGVPDPDREVFALDQA